MLYIFHYNDWFYSENIFQIINLRSISASQQTFICSKLTIVTLEKVVQYVQI